MTASTLHLPTKGCDSMSHHPVQRVPVQFSEQDGGCWAARTASKSDATTFKVHSRADIQTIHFSIQMHILPVF